MVSIAATHAPNGAYKQVLPGDKDTATTTGTPTESPSDDAALPLRDLPPGGMPEVTICPYSLFA